MTNIANKFDRTQIAAFVEGLFTLNTQYDKFRLHLRDFLVALKEFSGDNAELYQVEKETEDAAKQQADLDRRSKVGGLMKPSELQNDDDDEL